MIYRLLLLVYRFLPGPVQAVGVWLIEPKTTVGVAVAAFDEEGRLMLFQHRYDRPNSPRLPGGHIHAGEHPVAALHRELAEEGGATVELCDLVHIETSHGRPSRMTLYYAARLISPPTVSTAEITSWQFCAPNELSARMPRDQVVAIARARVLLDSASVPST